MLAEPQTKEWERRAAVRAADSSRSSGRTIARDIVDAAWALAEATEDGDFTMKQVAERADVALQTLYRYFGSKDELMLAVFEETIARGMETFFAPSMDATPVERLRDLIVGPVLASLDDATKRGIRWRARERERLRDAFPEAVGAALEPYRAALVHTLLAARKAGDVACDDPELTATVLTNVIERLILGVRDDGESTADRVAMAEGVWQLLWEGLAPRSGRRRRRR